MQALLVTLTHNLFQQITVPLTFRLSIIGIGIDKIYISANHRATRLPATVAGAQVFCRSNLDFVGIHLQSDI